MWREEMPLAVRDDQPLSRASTLALSLWPAPPAPFAPSAPSTPSNPAALAAAPTRSAHIINHFLEQEDLYNKLSPYLQNRPQERTNTLLTSNLTPQAFHRTTTTKGRYKTIIYPSLLPQNVRWSPFVQMAACATSSDKLSCCCSNCANSHCPGRDTQDEQYYEDRCGFKHLYRKKNCGSGAPLSNNKPLRDNIATFCDQDTMTCEMVNATCGICFGVDPTPRPCAEDRRDVSTGACVAAGIPPGYSQPYKRDGPRLTLEGVKEWEMDERPLHCDRWHEPERDPGPCVLSTATISTNTTSADGASPDCHTSLRYMLRKPSEDENLCCEQRHMLYNEGISDAVFAQLDNPVSACKDIRAKRNCRMECCELGGETWIPHSHQPSSKYHTDCKKYPCRRYRAPSKSRVQQECRQFNISPDVPAPVAAMDAAAAARLQCSRTNLQYTARRKLITSDRDIESFLQAYIF